MRGRDRGGHRRPASVIGWAEVPKEIPPPGGYTLGASARAGVGRHFSLSRPDGAILLVVLTSRSDTEGRCALSPAALSWGQLPSAGPPRCKGGPAPSAAPPAAAPRGGCRCALRTAPGAGLGPRLVRSVRGLWPPLRQAPRWPFQRSPLPRHATPRRTLGAALANPRGVALTVGTHTARSCHSVLLLLGRPPATTAQLRPIAGPRLTPPRSTRLRLSRAGRRGAQGLHSSPIRSPQGDTRSGYNRLVMRSAWEVARVPAPPSRRDRRKQGRRISHQRR